jgi:hypothetical protein
MSDGSFAPVVVAVFGISTPYAYWGFHVVRLIVEAISGKALHLHVSRLAELRDGFAGRDGGSVVVTCDLPDDDLARFVAEAEIPLITFTDDPGDAAQWAANSRGMSPEQAARFCSRLYSALAPLLTSERALAFIGKRDESPERAVAAIIEHLWPGRGDWLASATFAHLVDSGQISREIVVDRKQYEPVVSGEGDPAALLQMRAALLQMRAAAECYAELMHGKWPSEIVWPFSFFLRPDKQPWSDPIDLTGPARALLYGPYMHLPVGEWTARVEFEIDGAVSGVEAVTDVRVNETIIEKNFAMPAKGIFAYDLSFRVDSPHHEVEIRLFTKKAAIEGRFLPRSVRMRPSRRDLAPR